MEKEKKKFPWQKYLAIVFGGGAGVICGFLFGKHEKKVGVESKTPIESIGDILLFAVGLGLAMMIQIIIHEAGHLVFGLISGYQFSSFRIMSFMWVKQDGKIKLKKYSIAGTGGQCLMSPPDMVEGKFPVILYNMGGSLMNLIASAIFGVGYLLSPEKSMLSSFFLILAIIGVAFAAMNGIPMHAGMVDNDGYNAFALGKDKSALRAFWTQLKVNEQISRGVRIKDMPDEWFVLPADEEMKKSMTAAMGVFLCNRLMDQHKFEEANTIMKRFLEIDSKMAGIHRSMMICDRIYCELLEGNCQEATELMTNEQKSFMKSMKQFPSILRTNYVYALLCEHDDAKAQKYITDFEKCAKTYPYPSDIQTEREMMELAADR